jgi:branched-chain amino acid aminotransferase
MDGLVSINGNITSPDDAAIPALDRGFLFGDNIFEVIVGFGSSLIDLKLHLERLRSSAQNLSIPIPWSDEELSFELQELATQLNMPKIYLRLVITRGSGAGIVIPENLVPNKIIYAFPAKEENPLTYINGLSLKRKKLPFTERGAHSKTGNYLRSILAVKDAQKEGFDEVIWSNSEGEFTEASTANIFFIGREGDLLEIVTPSTQSGILKGLTRKRIQTLLRNAGIKNDERIIYTDELAKFDEAFICSTVRGLIPINRIDRHTLHTCRTNSVFRKIESLYLTWLEVSLDRKVDWNTGKAIDQQES